MRIRKGLVKGLSFSDYQKSYYKKTKTIAKARSATRYKTNKADILQRQKERRALDPEYVNTRKNVLRDRSRKELEQQAGRACPAGCEVCHQEYGRLDFDHDHETGLFRGWLCRRCNLMLGHAKDSPSLLKALADYLTNNEKG